MVLASQETKLVFLESKSDQLFELSSTKIGLQRVYEPIPAFRIRVSKCKQRSAKNTTIPGNAEKHNAQQYRSKCWTSNSNSESSVYHLVIHCVRHGSVYYISNHGRSQTRETYLVKARFCWCCQFFHVLVCRTL